MKATVRIEKSFDEGRKLSKEYESMDFRQFFMEEGEYLDRLCGVMEEHAKAGDDFTVTYTVTVEA